MPDVHEAQDLTQSFFAQLLEKNYVRQAIPERGRFRAFLLAALKHFLSKEWKKGRAQKRGGGRISMSLDFDGADSSLQFEPAAGLTAEQLYDQEWACVLLNRILNRLSLEFEEAGKATLFLELRGFLIGDHSGTTYAQVAERLKITNVAARQAVTRMRRRYRELLREEIAETVSNPAEVEDEIRNLLSVLQLG